MNVVIMILAIIFGLMLEQAVPAVCFAKPPVIMAVVAYYALNHSTAMMLLAALAGGILGDAIGALPMGITCLALAAMGTALHYSRNTVFRGKAVTNIVFGAAFGIVKPAIVFILLLVPGQTPYCIQLPPLLLKLVGSAVGGAVLFPLIYVFLERIELLTGASIPSHIQDNAHAHN